MQVKDLTQEYFEHRFVSDAKDIVEYIKDNYHPRYNFDSAELETLIDVWKFKHEEIERLENEIEELSSRVGFYSNLLDD